MDRDDYLDKNVPEDHWYQEEQVNPHLCEDDRGNLIDKDGIIVWFREDL